VAHPLSTVVLTPAEIAKAAEILRTDRLLAFPTETVYGLGANALSPLAVEKIFVSKQRPHWDPLIIHIADLSQLPQIAEVSPLAQRLIDRFWPGPLTLLLHRMPAVPDAVTAGRPLVGVRIPRHPLALALLREAGVPIAAPSANRFGHTSPTTAAHVLADLDGRIDAVLDGGPTEVGVESTVAEVTGDGVTIYRPGAVTLEMIESVTGPGTVRFYEPGQGRAVPVESLPSPGVGIRHYAPRATLKLIEVPHFRLAGLEDSLLQAIGDALPTGKKVGVMLPDGWSVDGRAELYPWGSWCQQAVLAQRLFSGLRALDDAGAEIILCPVPTGPGLAAALRDRLGKAAR